LAQVQLPIQRRTTSIRLAGVVVLLLALGACAAGTGPSHHAASQGPLDQFVLGIWHGVIAPVALVVEVLNRFAPHLIPWRFRLYETAAAGLPYDVGFYVGAIGGPWAAWTRGPWRR
jgi:hypothetical protein